ncbi:hypothetical protein JCM4814A_30900 [Streptomyces phaeofaciens JCM 4814]|uniref:Uncharacterized protein n=1 Tax=Streptomyces phaeofaciens TaxID=68254 RepID=A0A918LX68_9ACTN|nr:hypothetical protein [Streptomyces phaeofaciens]GGT67284.1 hypothetical protein GCM10010226_51370 [Streptomyces phaeofaciens]
MITPADDFDDGPDLDPDDPLTVVLRPPSAGRLAPPPGRYEEIRRGASRRRVLRAAAGVGTTCAIAALALLLPLRLTAEEGPGPLTPPLAPPPATSPSTVPDPSATPAPLPTRGNGTPDARADTDAPSPVPGRTTSPAPDGRPTAAASSSSTRTPTSASAQERSSVQPASRE